MLYIFELKTIKSISTLKDTLTFNIIIASCLFYTRQKFYDIKKKLNHEISVTDLVLFSNS